jgi:excisionase family DNA binding protein
MAMPRKMDAQLAEAQLSLDLDPVDDAEPAPSLDLRRQPQGQARTNDGTAPANGSSLLTTREAACLLHVHPRTVQRLVERGELAAVRMGTAVRFDPSDLTGLISGLKRWSSASEPRAIDSVRATSGARLSFADRLRSQCNEHRAAHA